MKEFINTNDWERYKQYFEVKDFVTTFSLFSLVRLSPQDKENYFCGNGNDFLECDDIKEYKDWFFEMSKKNGIAKTPRSKFGCTFYQVNVLSSFFEQR